MPPARSLGLVFVMDPIEVIDVTKDTTFALMLEAQGPNHPIRFDGLRPRRHKMRTVSQGPTIILHMGDLDPPGAHIECHPHKGCDRSDVVPVNDGIDRQRNATPKDLFCQSKLAREASPVAADPVGFVGGRRLQ